jgi:hypothetical protein
MDGGREEITRTRSAAWMLGEGGEQEGHTPVVLLEGQPGAFRLDRIIPLLPDVPPSPPSAAVPSPPLRRDPSLPDPQGSFELSYVQAPDGGWSVFWGSRQVGAYLPDLITAEAVLRWLVPSWPELEALALGLQRGAS